MKFFPIILGVMYLLTSCVSHRGLVSYQRGGGPSSSQAIDNLPEIRIEASDVLSIEVSGPNEKVVAPFVSKYTIPSANLDIDAIQLGGYLVSEQGKIVFPQVGDILVAGKTVIEIRETIVNLLRPYLRDPVVNVRLLSFRVTVSGEVGQEGSFNIFNERISIPEAIARAGGLTDYANRKNILLVRESGGERQYVRIDLTSADIFSSRYFYLKQNDLLYVKPTRAKSGAIRDRASKTMPIITAAATVMAVIISLVSSD